MIVIAPVAKVIAGATEPQHQGRINLPPFHR